MEMFAPVVLFAYKRLDTLKRVIASLEEAELSEQTDIYIFVDAAKRECDIDKNEAVKAYLEKWKENAAFKNVYLTYATSNKGLSNSIIQGVGKIMDEWGKAIVVEDDIVVSKDFLSFMNRALEYYEKDENVWAITGYTEELDILKNMEYSTFPWYRCDCWGWASWKDRWESIDWEVKDYRKFIFSPQMRRKMNRGGEDMARMLDAQMIGAIDSWAIRWGYNASKSDRVIIHPTISRVSNIGFDGEGSNCGIRDGESVIIEPAQECKLLPGNNLSPELHKAYLNKVNRQYSNASRIRKRVKSIWRRFRWLVLNSKKAA